MRTYKLLLRGKAKDVFKMLELLATTRLIETDRNWWAVRAHIIATGMDRQPMPRLVDRRN